MRGRPLAGLLLAGAAGLGAFALLAPDAPPATVVLASGARPAPSPVLQMIGLAAPISAEPTPATAVPSDAAAEASLLARLATLREAALPELEAFARRWPGRAAAVYEALASRWAQQRLHLSALQALARAPLDEAARARLRQQLLDHWADTAPDQAARWALAGGETAQLGPLQDRWLHQDARSAALFATQLPPGDVRQALLEECLSRWLAQDGPGGRDWLRATAPSAELDAWLARYAASDELAREAPAEALDLVARISAPERRWAAWQALAGHLHDIDPAQAAAWLSRAPGLTPMERQQLIDGLR